jgi:putative membrane protein insertion efficiency factor
MTAPFSLDEIVSEVVERPEWQGSPKPQPYSPEPQEEALGTTWHENDYSDEPSLRNLPFRLVNIPRFFLLAFIRLYQATLSRGLPANSCRFYPSCSHYGYQSIYKYGALKGSWMAAWRILRCNPFNRGGYDPVP